MIRRPWLYSAVVLALGGANNMVVASHPDTIPDQRINIGTAQSSKESNGVRINDGLEQLPLGMQALSYSTLVHMGKVRPPKLNLKADPNAKFQPRTGSFAPVVAWGPEVVTSVSHANEPDATLHPTDSSYVLVSGNSTLDNSTGGGLTWQSIYAPWPNSAIDVVQAFAPTSPDQNTAIGTSLYCGGNPCQLNAGRSTNRGVTWEQFSPNGLTSPDFYNDRPDLWSDNDPTSPFYGRMYLTKTINDPQYTLSTNTTATKYSTDHGQSWSQIFMHDDPGAFYTEGNRQFASMGFGPNGATYVGWLASRCCYGQLKADVPNKHRWARSEDGGVSFPISGTAATDPLARSLIFNDYGPASFRFHAQTDIGVDPVDGTMYMVWLRFRRDDPPNGAGAATFITYSTNQGVSWSAPATVYDDPDPDATHYMPWVEVSKDHIVHVTYTSDVGGSRTTLAHFYVQSTDHGQTWSTPFQLSSSNYPPDSFMGDYQQAEVVSYGNTGKILATWTDTSLGAPHHYARIGTFTQNIATPTPGGPTSTPGGPTPTPTPTPCLIYFADVPTPVGRNTPTPVGYTVYFHNIRCLACPGVISGNYGVKGQVNPCNGSPEDPNLTYFYPCNNVTRGHVSKFVSNAAGFYDEISPNQQTL